MTFQASRTYQRSLWGRGQQQATRSGYGATRFQPRWPVGSCRNSLPRSTYSHPGAADPLRLCLGSQPSISIPRPATRPGLPALPQHPWACHQALSWPLWDARTWQTVGRTTHPSWSPTFTAIGGDLSKRVVAAVTLASNDTRLAWTLAILRVTDSGQGARGVAVTQEAGGAARGPVVVLLGGRRGMGSLA